jgi:hypothetical protein
MSSVMMTLGLSNGGFSDGGLSDSMVVKSDRIDVILPRGLTLGQPALMATWVKEHMRARPME